MHFDILICGSNFFPAVTTVLENLRVDMREIAEDLTISFVST